MGKWACHEKDPVVINLYWDLDLSQLYIDRLQQVHIRALYSLSMELTCRWFLLDLCTRFHSGFNITIQGYFGKSRMFINPKNNLSIIKNLNKKLGLFSYNFKEGRIRKICES